MLDAVNVERMGIPAVVVVTEPFVDAAVANARAQGMADLSMVIVPHDYLEEDEPAIEAKLEPRLDELVHKLFIA